LNSSGVPFLAFLPQTGYVMLYYVLSPSSSIHFEIHFQLTPFLTGACSQVQLDSSSNFNQDSSRLSLLFRYFARPNAPLILFPFVPASTKLVLPCTPPQLEFHSTCIQVVCMRVWIIFIRVLTALQVIVVPTPSTSTEILHSVHAGGRAPLT
jgi:hypothetical protein